MASVAIIGVFFFIAVAFAVFGCVCWIQKARAQQLTRSREPTSRTHPNALPSRLGERYRDQPCVNGNAIISTPSDLPHGETEFFEAVTVASSKASSRDYVSEDASQSSQGARTGGEAPSQQGSPVKSKRPRVREHHVHHVDKGGYIIREVRTDKLEDAEPRYLRRRASSLVYGHAFYSAAASDERTSETPSDDKTATVHFPDDDDSSNGDGRGVNGASTSEAGGKAANEG
ncbi:hypothetical protein DQ04_08471030 [Trypanosoma grayi]|uniref:hypothetical protein n=1 Tax=Trypanosoma grayi TaxID=71804 RepID=UPI0004F4793A|nr:hypothetical protein DQ04_08471030 [Trypanosoma grayi]KEG07922.1 hypothetical protein DQ04_08471030 [Trypanosoma grayi]